MLVGGAAGVLTGELPAAWTTADVDVIDCEMPQYRDLILEAAGEIGRELSLPADWLNDWGGLFAWILPDNWKSRRIHVGKYGELQVYCVGRPDFIAMKFLAHRPHDLEHLRLLQVTANDLKFVRDYLEVLTMRYPRGQFPDHSGTVAMAKSYVDAWEVQ